ncbi:MAG: hypothetical protein R2715_02570 [Ilumatobacteraceae bacterium]
MHDHHDIAQFAEARPGAQARGSGPWVGGAVVRSPPRIPGVDRSIRREQDRAVVAVRTRAGLGHSGGGHGRRVIVASQLGGKDAVRAQTMWEALGFAEGSAAA